MVTSLTLTVIFLGVFLAYVVAAPLLTNLGRFLYRAWLFCPEHEEYARVGVHPFEAALTAGYGAPQLAVRSCTLLKPGERCHERCLNGADF
ncbi:MAG TPA: hypothetical protein VKB51_12890 [bacterium]|nr:hypothetical protein [bacterium]